MEVFSLLKFWKISGAGDPAAAGDFDSSFDDEESFFDLVFTNSAVENDFDYAGSPNFNGFSVYGDEVKSSFRFSSPDEVSLNKKRNNIFSFDSPNSKNSKMPQSPLRLMMLGFQNDQKTTVPEEKEAKIEIEEVKLGALLKRDKA